MTTSLETAGWLVDWRLAGRAGFPAAVHPEPLRGVLADGVLQYGVEAGGVGGAGLERDAGEAGGGAGRNAEKRHKETLRRRHVGVHEDADCFAGTHGGDQAAGEVVLVQDAVPVEAADAVDRKSVV